MNCDQKKVLPGFEPRSQDSKSYMLTDYTTEPVVMMGFEPTKHNASDLESLPFDRSGTLPNTITKDTFSSELLMVINHCLPWDSNPRPQD